VGEMAKSAGLTLLQQLATEMSLQPERAMALATELKKCHLDRDAVAESLRVDYQVMARAIEETKAGKTDAFSDRGLMENPPPLLYLKVHETKRQYAEFTRLQIENLSKPYAEMVRFEALDQPSRRGLWGKLTTPNSLGKDWLSRLDAKYLPRCCCMFDVKVAATRLLLTLKAYATAEGRLPERLDELVPDFLDAVPADPFDGKPMRYNPEKKVIYTVGEDLTDSGGTTEAEWLDEKRRECEAQSGEWTDETERIAREAGDLCRWRFPDPSWAIEF